MTKLSTLLHDFVDHITAPGNHRGELHAAVDDAVAEIVPASFVPDANPTQVHMIVLPDAAPGGSVKPEPVLHVAPKVAKTDGAPTP